tara:strand:+ start:55 stop:321 length:267 start_codon:yes stop_codon:yes gene_type:complete
MDQKQIKRNILSLAHARRLLTLEVEGAYESDDMVLYTILREARGVIEDGIDELSGAGKTPNHELDSIPDNTEWWDELRQESPPGCHQD